MQRGRILALPILLALAAAATTANEPARLLTADEARRLVAEVLPHVEALRGLTFKQPVTVEVVGDPALRAHVMAQLDAFGQQGHIEVLGQVYALLGLVPVDANILELLLEVLEEQTGGFYDPTSKAYFLLDDVPASAAPIFTAHELTHALEDQHFDLERQMRDALDNDDLEFARSSVREGSASLLMGVYLAGALERGELDSGALLEIGASEAGRTAKLEALPDTLVRQLVGPYLLGIGFLTGGNRGLGANEFPKEAANRAMRAGPSSSEQILHPEKYWDGESRDTPVEVTLRGIGRALGKGWTRAGSGVLGELTLGPLVGARTPTGPGELAAFAADQWTNSAAAGWGGDRWELWRGEGRAIVALLVQWDTPADAAEFAEALPARADLRWRREAARIALVAGDAGERADRLLSRMLR